MLHIAEDHVICDLAETYHILDYKELSPSLVAALCVGLNDDSRIKKRISGRKVSIDNMLLASICDSLSFIAWSKTEYAKEGVGKPKRILPTLLGMNQEDSDVVSFESEEDFMDAWNDIVGG